MCGCVGVWGGESGVRMDSCVGGEGGTHWAMLNYTIYLRQLVEICSSTEHVSDMLRVVDMCKIGRAHV